LAGALDLKANQLEIRGLHAHFQASFARPVEDLIGEGG
jgi:hypothetical protein